MDRSDPSIVLAHLTESRLRLPLNDPAMAGARSMFALVTAAAHRASGFCWQLDSEGRPLVVRSPTGPLLITLSCWLNYTCLHSFAHRTIHATALREQDNWFIPATQPSTVLWWIGAGSRPTAAEGRARLAYLRKHGSSPRAFSLLRRFTPDGRPERTGRFRPDSF